MLQARLVVCFNIGIIVRNILKCTIVVMEQN